MEAIPVALQIGLNPVTVTMRDFDCVHIPERTSMRLCALICGAAVSPREHIRTPAGSSPAFGRGKSSGIREGLPLLEGMA